MWQAFIVWESVNHIGDLASVIGVLLSIGGFWLTVSVARRAQRAAEEASRKIRLIDDIVDISSAIVSLEEIRRFHRLGQWPLLPDRYTALRKTLVAIKVSSQSLSVDQMTILQSALATLQSIERTVEKNINDTTKLDGAKFNNLLAKQADALQATLSELKTLNASTTDGKAR